MQMILDYEIYFVKIYVVFLFNVGLLWNELYYGMNSLNLIKQINPF